MQRSIDSFFSKGGPAKKNATPKATKRKIDSDDGEKPLYEKKSRSEISPQGVKNKTPQKHERSALKKVDLTKLWNETDLKGSEKERKSPRKPAAVSVESPKKSDRSPHKKEVEYARKSPRKPAAVSVESSKKPGRSPHKKEVENSSKSPRESAPLSQESFMKTHRSPIKKDYEKVPKSPRKPTTLSEESSKKAVKSPGKKDIDRIQESAKKHDRSPNKKSSGKVTKTHVSPKKPKETKEKVNTFSSPVSSKERRTSKNVTKTVEINKTEKKIIVTPDKEKKQTPKRGNAGNFYAYQNRPTVLNPGSKPIPKGSAGCLNGASFLVTGVLDTLERDECNGYIEGLGGKIFRSVGKTLKYLVVGQEAGPRKLEDAKKYGITILSEDDLFNLVRERSTCKEEVYELNPIKMEEEEECAVLETTKEVKNVETEVKTENATISVETKPLVEKHKPTSLKEIIGQHGATSNVVKLKNWLTNWFSNNAGKTNVKKTWGGSADGKNFKAALLSGPPGVGKTTTAVLVCKELQFDTIEMNASDTRNKRMLKEEVAELLSNRTLQSYAHGGKKVTKKHVLIMDEVDGMAGNEDRGGLQELIGFIKESSVPIICICNDRNHQKMRSLVNYCFDLRFSKPNIMQIKARILSICCKEQIKVDPAKIEQIIAATNNDIRQSINQIAFLKSKAATQTAQISTQSTKDLKLGPWDVIRKIFTASENKMLTFREKNDLFFHDYSMMPLFVQQNYLQVCPEGPSSKQLAKVHAAAESLSLSDHIDKCIRSQSAWALLPAYGAVSFLFPADTMRGNFKGQINFPGWLGKYSRANKCNRLAQELYDHTRIKTSGSRQSIRLDYAAHLLAKICRPLVKQGVDGVEEALNVLGEYHLLREDIESLIEISNWTGITRNAWETLDKNVKSAFTRAYNKRSTVYSYSAGSLKAKKAKIVDAYESEGSESEIEEDDSVVNDPTIKAKKSKEDVKKPIKKSKK